jgi:RNA polymerase sigma-B factor
VQELRLEVTRATGDLAQRLGRSPTVADLAAYLAVREEDLVEGLDSAHAYRAMSLHAPVQGEEPDTQLADLMGDVDHQLESVEDRQALRPLIAQLSQREQRILALRSGLLGG